MLFFAAILIVGFMLFFADSGEHAIVQAALMGSVVALIVSMLLLLQFLNNPFHAGAGGLRPVAMERSLKIINAELADSGRDNLVFPCDAQGRPRSERETRVSGDSAKLGGS